jgi:phospholipase/carboxylesterase
LLPLRGALLWVPLKYHPARPAPLVLLLHGAGGDAKGILPILQDAANLWGALVLAPKSRSGTWDVLRGGYGPDVAGIDAALAEVFERFEVDARRVAAAGFSDGASYALSLGLTNGDLFSDILAFSPGFAAPGRAVGRPRIFISHGEDDRVLPIDRCSRALAPRLRRAGYDLDDREFEGGHVVPPDMASAAMRRFLGPR